MHTRHIRCCQKYCTYDLDHISRMCACVAAVSQCLAVVALDDVEANTVCYYLEREHEDVEIPGCSLQGLASQSNVPATRGWCWLSAD